MRKRIAASRLSSIQESKTISKTVFVKTTKKHQQHPRFFRTKNKKTSRCFLLNIEKFLEVYADDLTNMLQRDYKL